MNPLSPPSLHFPLFCFSFYFSFFSFSFSCCCVFLPLPLCLFVPFALSPFLRFSVSLLGSFPLVWPQIPTAHRFPPLSRGPPPPRLSEAQHETHRLRRRLEAMAMAKRTLKRRVQARSGAFCLLPLCFQYVSFSPVGFDFKGNL